MSNADSGHAPLSSIQQDVPPDVICPVAKPYIWRITHKDGSILVRGDHHKGRVIVTPVGPVALDPQADEVTKAHHAQVMAQRLLPGEIQLIELIPAIEKTKWPRLTLEIPEKGTLIYGLTREISILTGDVTMRLQRLGYVSAFLGFELNGDVKIMRALGDGTIKTWNGTSGTWATKQDSEATSG